MVDILALAVSHGLLLLAAWRLAWRPDLDADIHLEGSDPTPPSDNALSKRGRGAGMKVRSAPGRKMMTGKNAASTDA